MMVTGITTLRNVSTLRGGVPPGKAWYLLLNRRADIGCGRGKEEDA